MLAELSSSGRAINWLDLLSLAWFLALWVGYSRFAKLMAKKTHSLSSVLHIHRVNWMKSLLQRDVRVGDAALIANLERQVSFFASTTILILAGLLTVIPNIGLLHQLLSGLSYVDHHSEFELQLRILVMVCVFVYAFFTFTWSMRQFGFCSILLGAAPMPNASEQTPQTSDIFARHTAKVIDQAGHSYNYGLRAYYFSMALLVWFVNQWVFMVAVLLVVAVLYQREFHSKPLDSMRRILSAEE